MPVMEQRFDLRHRPRRRARRIAVQAVQRLDAKVAVDQHQPLGVADHHHRYLLPDLGDRSDQSPPSLTVVDSEIAVTKLKLMEIDVHADTLPALPKALHLI